MATDKFQVVLDDTLFKDFHKFRQGEPLDKEEKERVKCLLHYLKGWPITNIAQYERTGIELDISSKKALAQNHLNRQSLCELARSHTVYKIVLCCDRTDFPYVNVTSADERIENNLCASYDIGERREKGLKHLKALCLGAKHITIYDKYFRSKEQRNIELLKQILPAKPLKIQFNDITAQGLETLKQTCASWSPELNDDLNKGKRHDRYIVIDDKIEVILSSGFDHISDDSSDFMYAIRIVKKPRF